MHIVANDGVIINNMGSFIHCSNGETYSLAGRMLTNSRGVVSQNCASINEALQIVIRLHGGRRL